MYSKEDRERILADMAASGLTPTAFSRLPGSPSRETLRVWRKKAERGELDVPKRAVRGRCDHAKHARYPEATVREAVSLARKGMRPADIARRLGVRSAESVRGWMRAAEGGSMAPGKGAVRVDAGAEARIAGLEAELAEERMRCDALREPMRDPKAGDPESLSNSRKAGLGERSGRDFGYRLRDVPALLRISKSSYEYARRANERAEARRAEVARRACSAFEASSRRYGYRRVRASIRSGADGLPPMEVSEREVRRAMREGGMSPTRTRRRRWSSYAGEPDGRPANLPLRADGTHDFTAPAPDRLVVSDVTEFKVAGGAKVYLSPVIDCFDGDPVAWSASTHPDSELTDSSLASYLRRLPAGHEPVVARTDGGATYRSASWKGLCAGGGAVRSMSRKGRCPDNARMEGFFGALKEEPCNGRDWSQTPPGEFIERLGEYIRWYRDERLKLFAEPDGGKGYETIAGRRRRLGYAV